MVIILLLCALSGFEYKNTWFASGNYAWGLCKKDSILIIDSGYGADLIDVSNLANPIHLSDARTSGYSFDVDAAGSYLYICDDYAGLRIFDISDPQDPTEKGFVDTPGLASKVVVRDSYAYVADDWEGLRIIDVGDPSRPVETGFLDTPGRAVWIDVDSIYAYVSDYEEGLQIISIEDPYNPFPVGQWDDPYLWYVWGVEVIDTLAYVAGDCWVAGDIIHFMILNIADPSNPFYVSGVHLPEPAHGLAVLDTFAYVCSQWAGTRIINIADPTNPFETNHIGGHPGYDILASDDILYIANDRDLNIYDITDPTAPLLLVNYTNPIPYTFDVCIDGNTLFLLSLGDSIILSAFDCSTPDSLRLIDTISLFVSNPGYTYCDLFFEMPYLYCGHRELLSILFFDGLHLSEVSSIPIPAISITKRGDYLYVGSGGYDPISFRVFDVSDPSTPQLVDSSNTISCSDIELYDTLAYVTGEDYFYILNTANPAHNSVISSLYTQHFGFGLTVLMPYVYCGNYDNCIQIIDVLPPDEPEIINTIPTVDQNFHVYASDSLLFTVGGDRGGLRVYDITNPTTLVLSDSFDTPGYAQSMAQKDSFFYIADWLSLELVKYPNIAVLERNQKRLSVTHIVAPNPARGKIYFTLPHEGVTLEVFDVSGRKIWTETIEKCTFIWNCRDMDGKKLPAGIYFVRMNADEYETREKILLVK